MEKASEILTALKYVTYTLVQNRDAVTITVLPQGAGSLLFVLKVEGDDVGRVIGKDGRTARALRTLAVAMGKKIGCQCSLSVEKKLNLTAIFELDNARCASTRLRRVVDLADRKENVAS